MSITITWHGHSCFSVSADGYSISPRSLLPRSRPGPLLPFRQPCCAAMATVTTAIRSGGPFPPGKQLPCTVTVIQTFHDDQNAAPTQWGKPDPLSWRQTFVSDRSIWATLCTLEPGQMEL